MNALDTNIWIYAHDSRDPAKQRIATGLISTIKALALPWQVGCEFLAAARKLESQGFTKVEALAASEDMRTMADALLFPNNDVWSNAIRIQNRLGLSLWDSLLTAACIVGGVSVLYSEDFGTLSTIDGLQLVNPFKSGSDSTV